jgi:hypothetical protein
MTFYSSKALLSDSLFGRNFYAQVKKRQLMYIFVKKNKSRIIIEISIFLIKTFETDKLGETMDQVQLTIIFLIG